MGGGGEGVGEGGGGEGRFRRGGGRGEDSAAGGDAVEGEDVALSEIDNVEVVADAGSITKI